MRVAILLLSLNFSLDIDYKNGKGGITFNTCKDKLLTTTIKPKGKEEKTC